MNLELMKTSDVFRWLVTMSEYSLMQIQSSELELCVNDTWLSSLMLD